MSTAASTTNQTPPNTTPRVLGTPFRCLFPKEEEHGRQTTTKKRISRSVPMSLVTNTTGAGHQNARHSVPLQHHPEQDLATKGTKRKFRTKSNPKKTFPSPPQTSVQRPQGTKKTPPFRHGIPSRPIPQPPAQPTSAPQDAHIGCVKRKRKKKKGKELPTQPSRRPGGHYATYRLRDSRLGRGGTMTPLL